MEERVFNRACRHCRCNPTALPPYVKMKQFEVTELPKTKLYRYAKKNKLNVDCVFCQAFRDLGSKTPVLLILNDERFM